MTRNSKGNNIGFNFVYLAFLTVEPSSCPHITISCPSQVTTADLNALLNGNVACQSRSPSGNDLTTSKPSVEPSGGPETARNLQVINKNNAGRR
jgi:hypothetical protein